MSTIAAAVAAGAVSAGQTMIAKPEGCWMGSGVDTAEEFARLDTYSHHRRTACFPCRETAYRAVSNRCLAGVNETPRTEADVMIALVWCSRSLVDGGLTATLPVRTGIHRLVSDPCYSWILLEVTLVCCVSWDNKTSYLLWGSALPVHELTVSTVAQSSSFEGSAKKLLAAGKYRWRLCVES